jgi:hypothetical protein
MEQSLPVTTSPEQTVASEERAEREATPRERRGLRVPVSVLVTLAGIALTAWLLPAFTRQWDDRQRAQELKAALVTDMAAATARALIGGEAIWDRELRPRSVNRAKIADDWSRSAVEIEARLSAYFPSSIVVSWQIYTWFLDRYVDGYRAQAYASLLAGTGSLPYDSDPELAALLAENPTGDADPAPVELIPSVASAAARVLAYAAAGTTDPRPNFEALSETSYEAGALQHLKSYLGPQMKLARKEVGANGGRKHFRLLQARLNEMQHAIALQILSAHARGFSTTRGDLLHDLLP